MGAISDDMMASALNPWMGLHGQVITVITGGDQGKKFTAVILVAVPVIFQGEVVQDNREGSTVVFAKSEYPQSAIPGDDFTDESGQVWRFGKRTNNPADSSTEFEVTKITESDN